MDQQKTLDTFFSDPEFPKIYDELILYAQRSVKDREWGGLFFSTKGRPRIDVAAIVNEILVKIRTATPEARGRHLSDSYPIKVQIKGMIKSEISNQFKIKANLLATSVTTTADNEDYATAKPAKEGVDPADTPDTSAMLEEELQIKEQWLREFIEFVKEPVLVKIIEGAITLKSRAEIAASAKISIQDYESQKKRLLRKRTEFASTKKEIRKI
jgi:hypothetical protein